MLEGQYFQLYRVEIDELQLWIMDGYDQAQEGSDEIYNFLDHCYSIHVEVFSSNI